MTYKLQIFCPDDEKIIAKIISAASSAGAGLMGKYSNCAFVMKGQGQWKSEEGSHPTIGKVGEFSKINEVKIEMQCPSKNAKKVKEAIKKVHPYEEPAIEFLPIENI